MKRLVLLTIGFVFLFSGMAYALTITNGMLYDDFNDGNADGWVFPYNPRSQFPGFWNVEDGTLVQHYTSDGNHALVDNLLISDQVIETQVSTSGYAGVVLWYQDINNCIVLNLNSASGYIHVGERIDGTAYESLYAYWIGRYPTWYDLMVDANSTSGELAVYLDGADVPLFTHLASTAYRSGRSGLWSGNEVGYFDNFSLTSDDIAPIPEPATILLIGAGLVGFAGYRIRKKLKK